MAFARRIQANARPHSATCELPARTWSNGAPDMVKRQSGAPQAEENQHTAENAYPAQRMEFRAGGDAIRCSQQVATRGKACDTKCHVEPAHKQEQPAPHHHPCVTCHDRFFTPFAQTSIPASLGVVSSPRVTRAPLPLPFDTGSSRRGADAPTASRSAP